MSYNVRDAYGVFGAAAAIEMPNGAGQTFVPKIQIIEPAVVSVQTPAASKQYLAFIAPAAPTSGSGGGTGGTLPMGTYQVVGVQASWGTASTSINVNVEKVASGTADGSGTNILTTNINTNTTAATPVVGTLSTNVDVLNLNVTDRLNVVTSSGTAGSIANLGVVIYVARVS